MDTITTVKELNDAILLLEIKQYQEVILLKVQFNNTYESLKPINVFRTTFNELLTAPDFKDDLLNTSISMVTGYLSKKIAFGSSKNIGKQISGSILQLLITNIVSKNADSIRTKFKGILNAFFVRKRNIQST